MKKLPWLLACAAFATACGAAAQESTIRKTLAERIPQLDKLDEVRPTPMPGLFEVRVGTDVFYTDATGNYLIQGELIDTKARRNLTEDRIAKLTAVDFSALPLADAFTVVQGSGARKLAVFADPNCGYCKRLERELLTLKDVTIYNFLYPILGADSVSKAKDVWCSKEPAKVWRDWMIDGRAPSRMMGGCDTKALERNVELGRKYRVTGTPAVVYEDGTRSPGAVPAAQIEQRLGASAKKG